MEPGGEAPVRDGPACRAGEASAASPSRAPAPSKGFRLSTATPIDVTAGMLRLKDPVWLSEGISWWIAIASLLAAFGGFSDIKRLVVGYAVPSAMVSVVLGFVLHELAHKYVANARGCQARFTISTPGLLATSLFGLIISLAGFLGHHLRFVIAAPGYVGIRCSYWGLKSILGGTSSEGLIALAGPSANIVLAAAGAVAARAAVLLAGPPWILDIFSSMKHVNSVLASFNLIPIPPFDGFKIARWNPIVYLLALLASLILVMA